MSDHAAADGALSRESLHDWLMSDRPRSRRQAFLGRAYGAWRTFARNRLAMVGLAIVVLLVLTAAFAEVLAPYSPYVGDLRTTRGELPNIVERLQGELKKARREADELRLKIATGATGSGSNNGDEPREVAGVRVLAREASGLDAAGKAEASA